MMQIVATALALLASVASAHPAALEGRDANRGCQDISFDKWEWTISDLVFNASYIFSTPAHQNSWGYVNFGLDHPALKYGGSCHASSNQLQDFFYGTTTYTCDFPAAGKTTSATFLFDRPSGLLNVTQSWTCSDKDPKFP